MDQGKLTDDEIKGITARAASLVKDVDEALRGTAFQKVFDALLAEKLGAAASRGVGADRIVKSNPGKEQENPNVDRVKRLLREADRTKYPEVTHGKKVLGLSLIVLRLARDDFNEDWLTPAEISRVLGEKFRLRATTAAVRMAISDRASYVNRRRRTDGNYEYCLMQGGENYLLGGTVHAAAPKTKAKPRKSRKQSAGAPAPEIGEQSPPSRAAAKPSRGVRRSPTDLLVQLIREGFFNTPRMIGQIVEHLEHQKAHKLKVTDLSPALIRLIRRGELTRSKGSNGQYEYKHQ